MNQLIGHDDGLSTPPPIHAACGKPLADHCDTCEECPRVPGPCWCATVGTDGAVADERDLKPPIAADHDGYALGGRRDCGQAQLPPAPNGARLDAHRLRGALVEMAVRYGAAALSHGLSYAPGTFDGHTPEFWARAQSRRFAAVQRLADALADAVVSR